jgi:hypothetical protein
LLAALACLGGCGPTAPTAPPGTGAREAAAGYFEALVRKDWPAAYALLAPESQKRVGAEQFARLAEAYRRGLGLEPETVHVNACDEHGSEAVAHVTLSGQGQKRHQFKDAASLRKDDFGWRIVLSPKFGKP